MKEKIWRHKVLLIVLLILIVAGTVTAVIFVNSGKDKVSAGEKIQKQSTVSLEKMDLTKSISATGTIQSAKTKTVSADVDGVQVSSVKAVVGDTVKKGEVLVTFDVSDLKEALDEAEESLSDAKEEAARNLASAKTQLSDAKETYAEEKKKQAEQVADAKEEQTEAGKQVSSLKKQVSAAKTAETKSKLEEELAKAEETLKQAEASYETAVSNQENTNKQNKNSVQNAEDAVNTAESNQKKTVKEAQKQVDEAEENLEKCSVTAPIDGIITAANVEEGDTYSGGDLFQIDNNGSYTVSTTVDEYDISSVSVGQRVVILTEATEEDELEGEITFVAPSTGSTSLTSGNSQTGENAGSTSATTSTDGYEIKIKVKTQDERLKMGLTAKCSIILEEAADVYAVPYDAVHENSDGTTVVYVSETSGDSVSSREVQVTKGMESDYYVEISGEELSDGMQIVIPTDESSSSSDSQSEDNGLGMFGSAGNMGGAGGGNQMRGNKGSGNMGGAPGM